MIRFVQFIGGSLDDLRRFPDGARRRAGYEIDRIQRGLEPTDWKPIATVGAGVREIRVSDAEGAFRVLYLIKVADTVFILHCFRKTSQKTSQTDIDLGRQRYRQAIRGSTP